MSGTSYASQLPISPILLNTMFPCQVYEMGQEVERLRLRDDMKLEFQDPIQRMLTVENSKQNMDSEYYNVKRQRDDEISRLQL